MRVCLALNIAADIFKVLLAGKLRKRLTLHTITVINKVSGVILVGFGMALLYGTIFLAKDISKLLVKLCRVFGVHNALVAISLNKTLVQLISLPL